jgi:hypothetical protein
MILFDVGFDAITALDFEGFELMVKDVKGSSRGMCNGFRSRQMYDEKDASRFEQILSFLSCRNDRMVADIVLEKQYVILSFRHATLRR